MYTTVEQRSIQNTLVGIISFVVNLLQNIIIVPIILNNWGTTKYASWIALFAGFTILQTLDLGHQNYIGNKINVLYHRDKSELQKVLSSSLLIAYFIGLIELLVAFIFIVTGNLENLLGISGVDFELAYSLLALMLMWFIFGSVSGILIRLLIPIGKLYEQQWISLIIRFIQFIVLLIIVLVNGSVLTAASTYAVVQSVLTIFSLYYIKKLAPEFYPWWKNGSIRLAFQNFLKSILLTFNNLIQQFSLNGLTLFVSNFYQVIQVPVFTTVRTLTNTAGSVTNIIFNSVSPDIVKYYSKGEDKKLFLALATNLFLSGLIINSALIISLFFIEPLYEFWTKGLLDFNKNLFLFLAAGISFSNYGLGITNYFFSINKLRQYTYIMVLKSLTLFTCAYLLLEESELATIGISVAVSELISSVLMPVYLMKQDNPSFFNGYGIRFFIVSVIPPFLILTLALINFANELSAFNVSIVLIITSIIYYINWNFIDDEVKTRIKNILASKFLLRK